MTDDGGGSRDRQLDAKGLVDILELMPMWMDPEGQERLMTRLAAIEPSLRELDVAVYEVYGVVSPFHRERASWRSERDRRSDRRRGRPRGDC